MNASLKNFGDIKKSRYQNIYIKSIKNSEWEIDNGE